MEGGEGGGGEKNERIGREGDRVMEGILPVMKTVGRRGVDERE